MVEPGQVAVVHLVARTVDGDEPGAAFETTDVDVALAEDCYEPHRDYVPLEFVVGTGEVPPAIDAAVRSMAPGDERAVTAEPADAYGERRAEAVVEVDRATLEDGREVVAEPGDLVGSTNGVMGWITAVDDETVTVDFNHEYAGDRVAFELRLLEVREAESNPT